MPHVAASRPHFLRPMTPLWCLAGLAIIAMALTACGGDSKDKKPTAASSTSPSAASPSASAEASATVAATSPTSAPAAAPTATAPAPTQPPAPTQAPAPTSAPAPVNRTVTAAGISFSPAQVTVPAGSTITWSWTNAEVPHNVAGNGFRSGDPSTSGNFSFKFTTPGTYPYHCEVHESVGMVGTITVQ